MNRDLHEKTTERLAQLNRDAQKETCQLICSAIRQCIQKSQDRMVSGQYEIKSDLEIVEHIRTPRALTNFKFGTCKDEFKFGTCKDEFKQLNKEIGDDIKIMNDFTFHRKFVQFDDWRCLQIKYSPIDKNVKIGESIPPNHLQSIRKTYYDEYELNHSKKH